MEASAVSAPSNPNAIPDYAVLPDLPLDADERAELIGIVWVQLVTGNGDVEEFLETYAEDYELTEEQLTAAFSALRDARLRQQAQIGDYRSRTRAAFDELNANGVIARADFTCCGTCASAEIGDERDESRHWSGFIYFHSQDTERLIEDGSTYVGYGAFEPEDFDEEAYNRLGDEAKEDLYFGDVARMLDEVVFPIVRRHGIEPEWNRDLGTRVLLTNADWYAPIES
ncbi:hypothetical protein FZI95_02715 [Mycobacterium sp. CBMA247]|nr:hypothetical protein [Mycolicibacterium sp. CBMA 329]MUL86469.1 hypothetical protein [Mycolicibacterium sp. CBMA 331]MUM01331.1 hypothetical protein [Mycolicibacterium sp. CBMA 334]MUM25841.1 hypothetical protein [Mycolicibacterium sp. CBMA 295]MUM36765.1 hypothetical protein [Mycolicibacterium sp. CBMA 247]MUM42533.1 hypothetical protein [Mycolicibacterium sp. CBMA 294]